jgi:hypothetical protein
MPRLRAHPQIWRTHGLLLIMLIHLVPLNKEPAEVREIKPGKALAGIAITRVELTFDDLDYEHLNLYLQNTVLPRLVPDPAEAAKPRWTWD